MIKIKERILNNAEVEQEIKVMIEAYINKEEINLA